MVTLLEAGVEYAPMLNMVNDFTTRDSTWIYKQIVGKEIFIPLANLTTRRELELHIADRPTKTIIALTKLYEATPMLHTQPTSSIFNQCFDFIN